MSKCSLLFILIIYTKKSIFLFEEKFFNEYIKHDFFCRQCLQEETPHSNLRKTSQDGRGIM
jgi:hypothetical protein